MKTKWIHRWPILCTIAAIPFSAALGQPDELPPSGPIPGRYIVVLKEGVDPSGVANRHGVIADHVYQHAFRGFAGQVPPGRLAMLQRDPAVAWVEPDQVAVIVARPKPPPVQPAEVIPTGVNRIGLANVAPLLISKVGIAIIDTGIDLDHPDLNVVGNKTFVTRTTTGDDDNGHGSHCAGIAAAKDNDIGVVGVAPGAPLYAVKVLSRSGSGTYSAIISGINWVIERASSIQVANMSLGGGYSDALNLAVANGVNAGIVFCVAAGNESTDVALVSPASCPEAITVSAVNDTDGQCGGDVFASFSNFGELVDIAAPGVNIYSTYKGGAYATMSGTSMASPHAAGAAAAYIAACTIAPSPVEVAQALTGLGWPQNDDCGFTGDPDPVSDREPMLHVVW